MKLKIKMFLRRKEKIPEFFKPILWSYNFSNINLIKDKKLVILNSINYGDLNHWRWITKYYGKKEIRKNLSKIPLTEIRPRAMNLASIIFDIKNFNYAPRSVK